MEITSYTVSMAIPHPLCLVQVADLHGEQPRGLIEAIHAANPDALVVTGDCLHGFEKREEGLAFLREMTRRYPVFFSLGNHETACRPAERVALCAELRDTGITLLDDEAVYWRGLCVGGVSSSYYVDEDGRLRIGEGANTAFLQRYAAMEGEKLLLCHHPEYYPASIRPLPIRLTLAGHAHGGQWRFFDRGVYAPGQGLFPPLTAGLHEGRLLISRGLGNPCHIPRIGNPRELCVLHLQPK